MHTLKGPLAIGESRTEPGSVDYYKQQQCTLTLVTYSHKLRHIPSLRLVLVLVDLSNTHLPEVVRTYSKGPLAIGESQTEPGSVDDYKLKQCTLTLDYYCTQIETHTVPRASRWCFGQGYDLLNTPLLYTSRRICKYRQM